MESSKCLYLCRKVRYNYFRFRSRGICTSGKRRHCRHQKLTPLKRIAQISLSRTQPEVMCRKTLGILVGEFVFANFVCMHVLVLLNMIISRSSSTVLCQAETASRARLKSAIVNASYIFVWGVPGTSLLIFGASCGLFD